MGLIRQLLKKFCKKSIFAVMKSMWGNKCLLFLGDYFEENIYYHGHPKYPLLKETFGKMRWSLMKKKKKSKEILEILRFYLDTFITSPISVIQLFSTHWLTTTAKIPIPYQVNFASLYTVLRFYFLSHLHLRIERNG